MFALRKELLLVPPEVLGEGWRMRMRHAAHPHDHEDADSHLRQAIQRNMTVFRFARTVGPTTRKKRQSAGGAAGRGPRVRMC